MLIYPSKCSIFVVCSLLNHRKITATRKKQPLFPAKSESNGGPAVLLEFYGIKVKKEMEDSWLYPTKTKDTIS